MILLPQGLNALKQVAKQVGADLRGASRNLDGGCDAARHRNGMCHTDLIPNITESPRKRKTTKRGRKRRFDAAIHALRMQVERTSAWEDRCQRLWLRFERLQQRHSGMTWLA
jgi:transposase